MLKIKNVSAVLLSACCLLILPTVNAQTFEQFMRGQPVIDVHLHLYRGDAKSEHYNPGGLQNGATLDSLREAWLIETLDRNQVVLAIGGGSVKYAKEYAKADTRIWAGITFPCSKQVARDWPCEKEFMTLEELKELYANHNLRAMGETLFNYYGIPPTDPRLDPYWAVAEALQLPIGVHADAGPNKVNERERPNYRPDYADPELLRPVLEKYPNLKLYLMHYGDTYSQQALALMRDYPGVYCDISAISLYQPKEVWEPNLRMLYASRLGDRLMFGSDFEGTIEDNLRVIYNIGWLNEAQKRDIMYFNAARFLGLSESEKHLHHRVVLSKMQEQRAKMEEQRVKNKDGNL
ncbi:amidohydrolase family protein [Robertkochia sediminum]|uniref:amidohydrolase family protein n=1 Tax=Robertkochia sediminum TaxID=2785326 RepID=UPI001933489D|nr:amidohydrolase family protein [Robertkochia sediminum]MBL7471431.1 amidohydrolase family protein [Robertkochia sediminum]